MFLNFVPLPHGQGSFRPGFISNEAGASTSWNDAAAWISASRPTAGIENAKSARTSREGRRSLSAPSFDSLRHSFNSALANAGVSQELRQKLKDTRAPDRLELARSPRSSTATPKKL
jgi:hypothetical protein